MLLALGVVRAVPATAQVVDYLNGDNNANPIVLNGDGTQLQVLTGFAIQSGDISEVGGPWGLEKIGGGDLALTGTSTYSGVTKVLAGTLTAVGDFALSAASDFQVNAGATLNLTDGVSADINSLADGPDGGGQVVIGTGSAATTLYLGFNGGAATSFSGSITGTGNLELDGGSLTLTGTTTIDGDLYVCDCSALTISGPGASFGAVGSGVVATVPGAEIDGILDVLDGASFSTDSLTIGGAMTADGQNTTVTAAGLTFIGSTANAATLTISSGAVMESQGLAVIENPFAAATALVTGQGSRWNVSNLLAVGNVFGGGTGELTISAGGVVTVTGATMVASDPSSTGLGPSFVAVTGAGSELNTDTLDIGESAGCGCGDLPGIVSVAEGGSVVATGPVTIAATSALNIGLGGLAGSFTAPSIANDGTIAADFTDEATLAADISGSGVMTKTNTGTLILTGDNSFSGGLSITGGTVSLRHNNAAGAGPITISGSVIDYADGVDNGAQIILSSDAQLQVLAGATATQSGVISEAVGGLGIEKIGAGTLVLTANNTYTGTTTISGGTLQVGNGGAAGTLGFGSVVNNGALVVNKSILTSIGQVSGSGSLTQMGSGTTRLAGGNTYTGATLVSAGTLEADGANAFGDNSAVTVNAPGTLDFRGGDQAIGSLAGDGLVTNSSEQLWTLTVGGDNTSTTFSGLITQSGNGVSSTALVKTGAGTLTLTGNNTFSGGLTIAGGTVSLGHDNAAGTGAITTTGSTIDYLNGVNIANVIILNSNDTKLQVLAGRTATQSGDILEVGARPLEKIGGGTLVLAGRANNSGTTLVSEGTFAAGVANAFSANSVHQVQASATLDIGGFNQSILGLTGTGIVTNNGGAAAILQVGLANAVDTTPMEFGGVIQDGASQLALVLDGTRPLILTGANTYTGGTLVCDCSTLQIGNGGTTGSIAGDVILGGVLIFKRSDELIHNGRIIDSVGGAGRVVQDGTGTTVLGGFNTYSGGTMINAGAIRVMNELSIGTGTVTFNGGAFQAGANSLTFTNAFALNTTGGTVDTNGNTLIITGVIANGNGATGALTKAGIGRLVLSSDNTYSGGTILAEGTLRLEHNNALGTGALTTLGSVIDYADGVEIGNGIVLGSNTTQLQVLNGPATQAGAISETGGARPLEKTGDGALLLTANNTYTGGTLVSGGSLILGDSTRSATIRGAVTVNNSVLSIYNADTSVITSIANTGDAVSSAVFFRNGTDAGNMTITNTGLGFNVAELEFQSSSAANATITGNNQSRITFSGSSTAANATISTDGNLDFYSDSTAGDAAITIAGTGSLSFSMDATGGNAQIGIGSDANLFFSGDSVGGSATITNFGNTQFYDNASAGGATIVNNGGMSFDGLSSGGSADIANNGVIFFLGSSTAGSATITTNGGANTRFVDTTSGGTARLITNAGGTVDISALTSAGATAGSIEGAGEYVLGAKSFTVGGNNRSTEVSGVISGVGGALNTAGTGTLTLTGLNTYTGGTTVGALSTLQLGNGGMGGSIAGNVSVGGTLAFNRSNAFVFNAAISDTVGGHGNVVQAGSGTTILTATNGYSGTTTVNAGTLRVDGRLLASSVTVNAGGTLGGAGTIDNSVTIASGGTLAPGASAGTMNIGSLTLQQGAILAYELGIPNVIGGGVSDLIVVNGNLTLDGTLNVTDIGGFGLGAYRLIDYAGLLTDNGLSVGTLPNGSTAIVQTSITGQVNLIVSGPGVLVQYWDGAQLVGNNAIDGGTGGWNNANTNWTTPNGTLNASWQGGFGIFAGTAGTVTLGETVAYQGLQFSTDGYVVQATAGGELTPTGNAIIRTDTGVTATIEAAITGSGGLQKTDLGTLILTGTNTYSGGTTLVEGILQIGNNGTSGSIVGDVASGGGLVFSRSDELVFGGVISSIAGAHGWVVQNGDGTTVLTANNTYTGGTVVSRGTLQIGNTGNTGTILGPVEVYNATLAFDNADTSAINTISNNASGGGISTVVFSNCVSAGGMTIANNSADATSDATVSFADNSSAGTSTINNTSFGTVVFNDLSSAGSALITVGQNARLLFAEESTAAMATIGSAGEIEFHETSRARSASITNGGLLQFFDASNAASATIVTTNGAEIRFLDGASGGYARFTTNAGGTFDISGLTSAGMNAGSIEGAGSYVLGSKTLTVGGNNSSTVVSGVISGSGGSLATDGTGTLTLTGNNTYTGATTVGALSTVQLGNGGASGSIAGDVSLGGTLVFNRSSLLVVFDGTISDMAGQHGNVVHNGAGATVLTADNSYTGATTVNAGKLIVNGSIASSSLLTIGAGASVGGTGTLSTAIISGTLAPGNSIGTLTVAGNLTMAAGSTYAVEVSPIAADRTNVTGAANLSGATVVVTYAAGTYVSKRYTILNALGGLGGTTFAGLTGAAPTAFRRSLVYDANNAYLDITLSFGYPPSNDPTKPDGLTDNQRAVATAIVNFFNRTGTIPTEFGALDPAGLTIASGEISTAAVAAGFQSSDLFMAQVSDPFVTSADSRATGAEPAAYAPQTPSDEPLSSKAALAALGAIAPDAAGEAQAALAMSAAHSTDAVEAAFATRWKMWGAAYGAVQQIGGDPVIVGSADLTSRSWGIATGFSRSFGDGQVGLALGGASSSFSLAGGLGSGSAGVFNAGIYGSQEFGNGYVSGAATYGLNAVKTSRVAFGSTLTGRFNAHTFSGRIEGGYHIDTPVAVLTPYAAVQATSYIMPGYVETATGPVIFTIGRAAQTEFAARTELGARFEHLIPVSNGTIKLSGRAAWAYNAAATRAVSGAFVALPGETFVINGAKPARNSALLDLGIEAAFDNGVSAKLSFSGEFSRNVTSYGASAKLSYRW